MLCYRLEPSAAARPPETQEGPSELLMPGGAPWGPLKLSRLQLLSDRFLLGFAATQCTSTTLLLLLLLLPVVLLLLLLLALQLLLPLLLLLLLLLQRLSPEAVGFPADGTVLACGLLASGPFLLSLLLLVPLLLPVLLQGALAQQLLLLLLLLSLRDRSVFGAESAASPAASAAASAAGVADAASGLLLAFSCSKAPAINPKAAQRPRKALWRAATSAARCLDGSAAAAADLPLQLLFAAKAATERRGRRVPAWRLLLAAPPRDAAADPASAGTDLTGVAAAAAGSAAVAAAPAAALAAGGQEFAVQWRL